MITKKLRRLVPVVLLVTLLASPLLVSAQAGTGAGSGNPAGTGAGSGAPAGTGAGSGNPAGTGAGTGGQDGTLVNPLKADSLEELLYLVLEAVITIGTIVLVLMLVWVGFLFVAARGNEEKLRTARTAFFWTIIGGLILLGSRGIAEVIQSTANTL